MIAQIKGEISFLDTSQVVVDTASGLGYMLRISLNTYSQIKEQKEVFLFTHFHISENLQQLFGFFDKTEKEVFQQLISVSGIGPSTAIMALSYMSPHELVKAISSSDIRSIQSIKGIGPKSAQRIVLELKDKMAKIFNLETSQLTIEKPSSNKLKDEALEALLVLGIPKNNAEKTIDFVLQNRGNDISLEELIKSALRAN
ncbi:MAG: Holliday junction branch migration protein RuvA [Cytophagales bacterium]